MKRMIALCAAFILALNLLVVLPASAADGSGGGSESDTPVAGVDYTFSLEQTLALYGTTITGIYNDTSANVTRNITFTYLTDSLHIGDMSQTAQNLKIGTRGTFTVTQKGLVQQSPYLVYVAQPDDWGGGAFVSTNSQTNVQLSTSIPMVGLNRYSQNIAWTIVNNTNNTNIRSNTISMLNGDTVVSPSVGQNSAGGGAGWVGTSSSRARALLEFYAWDPETEPQPDENYQGLLGFMSWSYDSTDTQISFNRQALTMRNNGTVPNSGYVYLLVGCPITRQDSILPPTPSVTTAATTSAQTTTRGASLPVPHTTGTSSDLSGIEADLARIIRNQELQMEYQEWIGTNQMYAVDNLALICEKLDKIYDLMLRQGDIQEPENTELGAWMTGQLSTSTTARLPDEALEGVSFLTWMMTSFQSQIWLYTISMLSLACLTTYWFLFKGRH